MTIALMALIGIAAGVVIDAIVARLAREPYERAFEEDEAEDLASGASLDLSSEAGVLQLPALLDGKARYRTLVLVGATAFVFALIGLRYEADPWQMPIIAVYASALIICSATDVLAYRVPNVVTYPVIIFALAAGMTLSGADRLDVVLGGLFFGGLLLLPSLLAGGAMGMGDVKLALFVGFALGFGLVIPAMLLMALGGGAAAIFLLVTRVRGRRDPIPYAPFIAAGGLIVMLTQGTAFVEL